MLYAKQRSHQLTANLKVNDQLVCVHTIDGKEKDKQEIPVPDIRANKPFGIHDKSEDQTAFFQRLIDTRIGNENLSIAAPNEISLSLSISSKSRILAKKLKQDISNKVSNDKDTFYNDEVKLAYDYLEQIQKSIVFGYKSVESFCNASIPEDYIYKKKNSKKIVEHYEKEQIERWINTSEKVSSILPDVLQQESPVSEIFWSDFKNLERIRNEIVHSKSSSTTKILAELFSDKIDDYILSSLKLLEYFISKDPTNPIFPLGFGVSKILVRSVEDSIDILEIIG